MRILNTNNNTIKVLREGLVQCSFIFPVRPKRTFCADSASESAKENEVAVKALVAYAKAFKGEPLTAEDDAAIAFAVAVATMKAEAAAKAKEEAAAAKAAAVVAPKTPAPLSKLAKKEAKEEAMEEAAADFYSDSE